MSDRSLPVASVTVVADVPSHSSMAERARLVRSAISAARPLARWVLAGPGPRTPRGGAASDSPRPAPGRPAPALTKQELEVLLTDLERRRASGRLIDRRDGALIYVMGRLGPRRGSLEHLRWRDFGLESGRLVVTFRPTTDRYARIGVPDDVRWVLARWHSDLGAVLSRPLGPDDAVFPATGRTRHRLASGRPLVPLTGASVSRLVRMRLQGVGLERPGFATKALRETAFTIAEEHDASVDVILAMFSARSHSTTLDRVLHRRIADPAASWTPQVTLEGGQSDPHTSSWLAPTSAH